MNNKSGRPPQRGVEPGNNKTPKAPDDSGHGRAVLDEIFDSDVLKQVEAELRLESSNDGKKKKRYTEADPIELPKLIHMQPVNPWIWLMRQIKRLVVLVTALCLVYYGGRWAIYQVFGPPEKHEAPTLSVELPKEAPSEVREDRQLKFQLDQGRASLASSKTEDGLEKLRGLARDHPETRQGQKAMLTLAATYRYNLRQPQQAVEWYESYLKANSKGREAADTMVRLAALYEETGQKSQARQVYEKLLSDFNNRRRFTTIAEQGIARTKE